jgi:hypothetical protein
MDFLDNIHTAINTDPLPIDALNIGGPVVTVVIHAGTMQIAGVGVFTLSTYNIASLAALLNTLSYGGTAFQSESVSNGDLSALALLDGTYTAPCVIPISSNPIRIYAKTVNQQYKTLQQNDNASVFQATPQTAVGVWLDSLGEFLKVYRLSGEPDSLYAIRLFDFSLGIRVNNIAIEVALQHLGYTASVVDTTPYPAFNVTITLPTASPNGYVYSIASLSQMVEILKAAGVSATIILQGSFQDTVQAHDSISETMASKTWTWGNFQWGRFNY